MNTFIWIIACIVINTVIGAIVITLVTTLFLTDDELKRYEKWADSAPSLGWSLVLPLWPLFLIYFFYVAHNSKKS